MFIISAWKGFSQRWSAFEGERRLQLLNLSSCLQHHKHWFVVDAPTFLCQRLRKARAEHEAEMP